jgi:hypothetical protein
MPVPPATLPSIHIFDQSSHKVRGGPREARTTEQCIIAVLKKRGKKEKRGALGELQRGFDLSLKDLGKNLSPSSQV